MTSPKSRRKARSRNIKDEPYQLNFAKKKKDKALKENNPKDSGEGQTARSKVKPHRLSKSKSREKGLKSVRMNL